MLDSIGIEDEDAQVHGITSIVSADWDDGTTGLIPLHNFSSTRNVQHSNTRRQIVEPEILFEIGRYLAFAAPLKVVHLHFVYCLQSEGLDEIAKWLSFMSNRIHGRVSFHSHPIGKCLASSNDALLDTYIGSEETYSMVYLSNYSVISYLFFPESYVDGQNSLLSHGIPAEAIHMLDERFWGYERDRRLFDGKRGSMLTSITKGLPIGKSLVVEKNNSEDSSSSSSTGLDSKFTSNNSLLQKDTSRNQYSESRGVEVLHSPGGGVILNSRSFLPSDTIDRFENSRLIAPRATLRGDDDCTKKRKRAGPVTLPSVLYFDDDADHLSPYQCLLRQQIEIFEACSDDVQYNASRMNRVIVLSQVGLRCRHCAGSPEWERANGAVYYPGTCCRFFMLIFPFLRHLHVSSICKMIVDTSLPILSLTWS